MKTNLYFFVSTFAISLQIGCSNAPAQTEKKPTAVKAPESKVLPSRQKVSDAVLFKQALAQFKQALKEKNKQKVMGCFNFPVQTAPKWSAEDVQAMPQAAKGEPMEVKEFATYYDDVFTPEVNKIMLKVTDSEVNKIDSNTDDPYYQSLAKTADKGSSMYVIEKQYPQDNGQETSFGFVFGKVGGKFKIISYYRPWPLK